MPDQQLYSISEFARFARTTRDTLLFYDRIKLLSPASRGERGDRFYSVSQVAAVNIIRTAQQLGFSLAEIKTIIEQRTPAKIDAMLTQQIGKIEDKISEWVNARKLLSVLQDMIHSALDEETNAIVVKFLPVEAIILGEVNDYSRGRDDHDALLSFYNACKEKYPSMDLNHPVWGAFSEQRIRRGDWHWPDRYYFSNPEGYDRRPAALYAIGYGHGGYNEHGDLFKRLMEYISANGYEVCGPAYAEYPLNEICVSDPSNYLIRILITVRKLDE